MRKIPPALIRAAGIVTIVGGIACAVPLRADPIDTPAPRTYASSTHERKMEHKSEEMAEYVEDRIKSLHSKLGITDAQEAQWGDVAQVMRDNEAAISLLIQQRHKNPAAMTAVDDLQSYESIAQAHLDGLKKMIPVFLVLYTNMPDDQKKLADKAFGHYEGRHDGKLAKKHM